MGAIPAYSFPFAFICSAPDALVEKKSKMLHLSMQRKHHKCKVLKVIGSEEKKQYIFYILPHSKS